MCHLVHNHALDQVLTAHTAEGLAGDIERLIDRNDTRILHPACTGGCGHDLKFPVGIFTINPGEDAHGFGHLLE